MFKGEMQQPKVQPESAESRLHLPKSLFGFKFGYQVQRQIRELDPVHDNTEHFSLTHETLYSNRIMTRALPNFIFARVAVIPEIAQILDYGGHGGIMADPRKRNTLMMHSFGRTLDQDPEAEAKRLGRIHRTMPIQNLTANMKFVVDTMILSERHMLDRIGAPEMEDHYQISVTTMWSRLLESMAKEMSMDLGESYGNRTIEEIESDFQEHIKKYGRPSLSGQKVADACRKDFSELFKYGKRPVASHFFLSMFDSKTRETLNLANPDKTAEKISHASIRAYLAITPKRLVHKKPWTKVS